MVVRLTLVFNQQTTQASSDNGLSATRYLGSNGTETAGSEAYNINSFPYDSKSFNLSTQDGTPFSVSLSSSGNKLYMAGNNTDSVYQYSLSTANDISTAVYDSVSFSVTSQDTQPYDLAFKSDGTKMYILGATGDSVYQYSLSTAWDLTTASYDSVSFSINSQDEDPRSFSFNSSGTKMYVMGTNLSKTVYQYSLATAWGVSTASYDSISLNVSGQAPNALGLTFNSTGTKMFVSCINNDRVYQYSLSTADDLSTASYDNVSLDVSGQDINPYDITFSGDDSKMYMVGLSSDTVYQYSANFLTQTLDLSTGTTFSFTPSGATTVSFTNPPASGNAIGFSLEINGDGSAITWPSSVKWDLATAPTATATKELYTFVTTDGGTTYYGKKAAEGIA